MDITPTLEFYLAHMQGRFFTIDNNDFITTIYESVSDTILVIDAKTKEVKSTLNGIETHHIHKDENCCKFLTRRVIASGCEITT